MKRAKTDAAKKLEARIQKVRELTTDDAKQINGGFVYIMTGCSVGTATAETA